jgi:hypothetical protein
VVNVLNYLAGLIPMAVHIRLGDSTLRFSDTVFRIFATLVLAAIIWVIGHFLLGESLGNLLLVFVLFIGLGGLLIQTEVGKDLARWTRGTLRDIGNGVDLIALVLILAVIVLVFVFFSRFDLGIVGFILIALFALFLLLNPTVYAFTQDAARFIEDIVLWIFNLGDTRAKRV